MSNREFWEEDPELLWAYRKSYMDKMKVQTELNNYNAWLNGLYVFDAISKALYNSLSRKEGQPVEHYRNMPIDFSKTAEDYEKEERLKVEEQIRERNKQIRKLLKQKE